jgi:formylglycine-generating enzyme
MAALAPAVARLAGALLAAAAMAAAAHAASPPQARARIPGTSFTTVLPPAPGVKEARIETFDLDRTPVTNAQFAQFVRAHAEWRRDRVARVFADDGYLSHWAGTTQPGARIARQPVTHVSWFAASAYCEARGARLPSWHEWEWVAAASETQPDARANAAWRQRILDWYARPGGGDLPDAGLSPPNYHGVHDVHGVVWEWVLDVGALMSSVDSREQGDPDLARFCGAGAAALEQKENYAMFMRLAMLSSMKPDYSSGTMGFRCAASPAGAR